MHQNHNSLQNEAVQMLQELKKIFCFQFPEGDSNSEYVFIVENPKELILRFPIKGRHKLCKYTTVNLCMVVGLGGRFVGDSNSICMEGYWNYTLMNGYFCYCFSNTFIKL